MRQPLYSDIGENKDNISVCVRLSTEQGLVKEIKTKQGSGIPLLSLKLWLSDFDLNFLNTSKNPYFIWSQNFLFFSLKFQSIKIKGVKALLHILVCESLTPPVQWLEPVFYHYFLKKKIKEV
jgi:hypothetical protein